MWEASHHDDTGQSRTPPGPGGGMHLKGQGFNWIIAHMRKVKRISAQRRQAQKRLSHVRSAQRRAS